MKNVFHVFLRMFTKFFGERPSKLAISLCVALFASTTAFAEEYITDVMVIGGDKDRVDFLKDSCRAQGWTIIDKDLNDNAGVGTDYVYLLYKKSSESGGSNGFITDFIIKTDEYPDSYIFNGRTYYRIPHKGSEHFEIHGGNLNSGTVSSSTNMRLYYTKEEFPDRRFVRDIAFTDAMLKSGYTTLGRNGAVVGSDGSGAMDLNEGAGSSSDYIYMHFATVSSSMDTPEYISDVVVLGGSKDEVNTLKERYASRGWIVIDQDLNDNAGAGTDYIYMAYKKSHFSDVNKGFITDFIIKTGEYPDTYKFNGRTYYRASNFGDGNFAIYGGNLNSGTVSSSTNMWLYFTRESFPDTRVVSDIAFTVDEKTLKGYTTLGENGAAVGSDGSGAMDLNEGAGSSSDYIYMHFATAPKVNITFVTGLNNVSVPMQTVVSGSTATKPANLERSGFTFMGWYTTADGNTQFDFSAPITSNTTVYARWGHIVTFVTGDANVVVPTQAVFVGDAPTKPSDPERTGLKFAGWYADESFTTEFDFSAPVTSNTTVYAKWEASVTFVTGVENVSVPTQTIVFGNTPTKPADLERSGFTFMGWYTTANGTTQFDFSAPVTNDVSVYARWAHLVTFVTGDANVVVPTQLVFVGEAPTKPSDPERSGFKFLGWYADESFTIEFDFSAPVTSNITVYAKWWNGDLSTLANNGSYVAEDGYVLRGELASISKISIADGATVTLDGVTINGENNDAYKWAGITCEGDCKIILKDENTVKGFHSYYPGIYVPEGKTLIIEGDGLLDARSNGDGAGIGGGYYINCGNIVINDGTVIAMGGSNAAGIGSGYHASAGSITISGGTVTATGGYGAAGIGSGYHASAGSITISGGTVTATGGYGAAGIGSGCYHATAGDITISGGTVTATGGNDAAGIGSGYHHATAGSITISGGSVTATGGRFAAGIGSGYYYATAGDITISGGTVTATGGSDAAGIGSGYYNATVGDITITDGVTLVTVNKGESSPNSVGLGIIGNSVGKISIGGVFVDGISESPYTFQTYDVVFNANGGTGNMEKQRFVYEAEPTVLTKNTFTREGYTFVGWNTKADGSGTAYADGAKVQNLTDEAGATVTLYAQWLKTEGNVVNLKDLVKDSVVKDGSVLTGSLGGNYKISIADGASVTLYNVFIDGVNDNAYEWAGINCLGDCNIILEGENSVKGFWEDYPGIHVPEGHTLTIEGNGSLDASSSGWGAGLGGGFAIGCGNIEIKSGTVVATGGKNAAGIGLGEVRDGVVTSCGDITIASGVTRVTARGGDGAPYSIGIGTNTGSGQSSVGKIIIDDEVTGNISTSPFTFPKKAYTVVFDKNGGDGAMVDQTLYIGYEEPLSRNLFTREKYVFVGWNTDPNGNGVAYDDGAKVQNLTDEAGATVTLYAQWWNGNLSMLKIAGSYVAEDGYVLRGKLASNSKISIADGATVTLDGVTINGVNNSAYKWAGLTCKGDCKIILKGENTVKGFHSYYPGIYVPERKTLTVEGDGSLDASSNGRGAGIGGGDGINCGNIVINAGTVTATGGKFAAGIGSGYYATAGDITIGGGSVTATGGNSGAGIGSGYLAFAGSITIGGGTVTATGGYGAAGIGSGYYNATVGDITITDDVTLVTANKGERSPNSVGLGKDGKSVGKISIGGVFVDGVSTSPFTYPANDLYTYTIVFDANGGEGTMSNQKMFLGFKGPLLDNAIARSNYAFMGWNTAPDGNGTVYADGASVLNLTAQAGASVTLYAQWLEGNVVNLKDIKNGFVVQDGYLLKGTLGGNYKVSIADGATVTLDGVTINGENVSAYQWAGLTCKGDCKIILKGENSVKGFYENYPGIYVPEGKTLTIEGSGSLDAGSNGRAAGIGGGLDASAGSITISGGTVTAMGGESAAGIGSGDHASAGSITISGGTVTATGGSNAAGIGSGFDASAGDITIGGGTVTATGGSNAAGIGSGFDASAGDITIGGGSVTATGGDCAAGIGSGDFASAGDITISGGTVTATGGQLAAGIGSGPDATAGDITITDGVTLVTANKGERSSNSVGLGKDGKSVGKISIGGVVSSSIDTSPFTFQTYDVVFDANGGSGVMEKQRFVYNADPLALAQNEFTHEGFVFVGWNTKADGSGTAYTDKEKVQNLTDEAGGKVTLYAQWGMPYIDGNGKEQIKQSGEYIVLTGTTDVSTLSSGWYVVMGEVTYENSFDFAGKDVHLILADGAKLTVVNNRADAKTEFNNLSIYAQSKDDKMGAFVVNSSNGDAIKVGENFVINGGAVTAAGSVDAKVFLAGGTAKAYGYKGSVSVKDGLFYTDGKGNSFSGTLTDEQIAAIAGKNMHPYIPAIQFKKYVKSDGSEGTIADFNANYNEIVPFGISEEMTVDSVEFKREFTTVTNGYATVIFPFDVQANNLEGVETVVAFGGVNKQYQVLMNVVWDKNKPSDFTLKAHTPYMVHMNKPTLNIHGPVTLKPIKEKTYEVEIGNWKFIGTYVFKEWGANDKDLGHAYGYTTVSTNNFSAGQFVIIAKNAITRAFRAYLVETQPQAIAARKPFQNNVGAQTVLSSSYSTPEYMEVVIIDKDEEGKEHTTVIGRFNTRTGEIKLNPVGNRVYDLKGRTIRKDAKKAKGVYYGKKVGISNQGKI